MLTGSGNGINDFRGHLRKNKKHFPAYSIAADVSTDVKTRQLAVFIHGCIHTFFLLTKLRSHITEADIFCELGNLPKLGVRISTYRSCFAVSQISLLLRRPFQTACGKNEWKSWGHGSQFSFYEIRTSLVWQSSITGVQTRRQEIKETNNSVYYN